MKFTLDEITYRNMSCHIPKIWQYFEAFRCAISSSINLLFLKGENIGEKLLLQFETYTDNYVLKCL